MFQLHFIETWIWYYFLEKLYCVWMWLLSDLISRPGTSAVQEGLFRNTQSCAKCWSEYDSLSICKEDVGWCSVVCERACVCVCVDVCVFVWMCVRALSLSGSVRVWGGAERFRQTAAWAVVHTDHWLCVKQGKLHFFLSGCMSWGRAVQWNKVLYKHTGSRASQRIKTCH